MLKILGAALPGWAHCAPRLRDLACSGLFRLSCPLHQLLRPVKPRGAPEHCHQYLTADGLSQAGATPADGSLNDPGRFSGTISGCTVAWCPSCLMPSASSCTHWRDRRWASGLTWSWGRGGSTRWSGVAMATASECVVTRVATPHRNNKKRDMDCFLL